MAGKTWRDAVDEKFVEPTKRVGNSIKKGLAILDDLSNAAKAGAKEVSVEDMRNTASKAAMDGYSSGKTKLKKLAIP